MIEVFFTYLTYSLSFLFCFVLSRLEQRNRKSKIAATAIAFVVIGGLFRRVSNDGVMVSAQYKIPHLLAVAFILAAFLGITVVSKKILATYFKDDLSV